MSRETAETTPPVIYQPAPQHPATQQLVLYQDAPQQLVPQQIVSQQLVIHQNDTAQAVFWDTWVAMLQRLDALAHTEVDKDRLIKAFESRLIANSTFPAKKRVSTTRPARHHPYRRSASRQHALAVRGRGKDITSKIRSLWSEASGVAATIVGHLSDAHIQQSPHPDPALLVLDAQPSQADNTILDAAVTEQVFEPAVIPQLPQIEPAFDTQIALPSPIAGLEMNSVALAPIPQPAPPAPAPPVLPSQFPLPPIPKVQSIMQKDESTKKNKKQKTVKWAPLPTDAQSQPQPQPTSLPQPAPALPALPAVPAQIPLPPVEKVQPVAPKKKSTKKQKQQQTVKKASQPAAVQPQPQPKFQPKPQPQPKSLPQPTPAPVAFPSGQKALPAPETVDAIVQKAKQSLQQKQQQSAQQTELPAAAPSAATPSAPVPSAPTPPAAAKPEQAKQQSLPAPSPAPAPEEEEEDELEAMMLQDLEEFDADQLGYHAEHARHAASFEIQAAQRDVANANAAEAEAEAPSPEPSSSSVPAPAGPVEEEANAPKPLMDELDKLLLEEEADNKKAASKKPAWKKK